MVESARHRDPMQPRRQSRVAPVARQCLERRQEDLLHNVFGVLVVAQDPPDDRPDVLQVALDEEIERLTVPRRARSTRGISSVSLPGAGVRRSTVSPGLAFVPPFIRDSMPRGRTIVLTHSPFPW